MSEEAIEVVRRGWDAYERGDLSAVLADVSPDLVTHLAAPLPVAGTYHGPEGMLQSLLDFAEPFDEFDQEAEEFIDAGNGKIIVRVHQTGRVAGTSTPVEGVFWFVFTVKEGKTVRMDIRNDKAEALKAAGLSE